MGSNIAVLGSQFCAPHETELVITRKSLSWSGADFNVTDVNGKVVLKVEGKALKDKRLLEDAAGNVLISMYPKFFSAHQRWRAYIGKSSKSRDLLFSVKRSSVFQGKTKLAVYLKANSREEVCDFVIEANWSQSACTVHGGNSSTVLAKMKEKTSFRNQLLGRDTYRVTVKPHVDHAFIVALMIILNEIDALAEIKPPDN